MKKISFILFAILSISNFNFSQFAEIPQKTTEFVISKKDFNSENILKLLFNGKINSEYSAIAWKPYPKENVPLSFDNLCYTNVDSILYFNNEVNALVTLRSVERTEFGENDCASCSPTIGLAFFELENGKWKLLNFNHSVTKLGQGGFVPRKKIVQIGSNEYVLSLNGEDLAGGGIISPEYEYWFRLNGSNFSEVAFMYYKSEIANDLISVIQRDIEIIKSDENEFYELVLNSKILDYENVVNYDVDKPIITNLPQEKYQFKWGYNKFVLK